jgi:hypothetical protein
LICTKYDTNLQVHPDPLGRTTDAVGLARDSVAVVVKGLPLFTSIVDQIFTIRRLILVSLLPLKGPKVVDSLNGAGVVKPRVFQSLKKLIRNF